MADLGTATTRSAPDETSVAAPDDARTLTRRRTLPGGRAVAGALLVTAAAVGVFAAYLDATAAPSTTWVVAAEDVAPGTRLEGPMLTTVPIDLPPAQAEAAYDDPTAVVGTTTVAPVQAGELVQRSAVLSAGSAPDTATYTFALPAVQALGGALVAGDRVDVAATRDGTTTWVARSVQVLSVGRDDTGRVVVTAALADDDLALEVVNAVDTATVHLVRPAPGTSTDDAGGDAP